MKKKLLALLVMANLIAPHSIAHAATDCAQKVCVEVYTDPTTNQLVIKARKGSGPVSPKPLPTHSPAPASPAKRKVVNPATPRATRAPRPYVYRPYTPRANRVAKVTKPATSLVDQLSQLIPTHNFFYQPSPTVVVGIPVYLWSDTNPQFSTVVTLLGEAISVDLQPSFTFNFGDGTPEITSNDPGAPYPAGSITHRYLRPGDYPATLRVSWGGQWSAAGVMSPVMGGAIVQNYQQVIHVSPAPTKYIH